MTIQRGGTRGEGCREGGVVDEWRGIDVDVGEAGVDVFVVVGRGAPVWFAGAG